MKTCPKCKETKSLEDFSKNNSRKDGRCFTCKNCVKKYNQENKEKIHQRKSEWYQKNKTQHLIRCMKYRQSNKDHVKKQKAEYYQKNKDKITEHMAEYYQKNKESFKKRYKENEEERKETRMEYRRKNPVAVQAIELSNSVRRRAKDKKLPIDLDFISFPNMLDWLKRQPRCECCNVEFNMGYKGGKHGPVNDSPSIDKFYPDKGYVEENVHLLCWACNRAKGDADLKRMKMITEWMDKKDKQIKGEKKGRMTWTYTELHPAVLHKRRMEERQAEG